MSAVPESSNSLSVVPGQTAASIVGAVLQTMRPYQWLKNLLVFVPLAASHRLGERELLGNTAYLFVAFSLCARTLQSVRVHQDHLRAAPLLDQSRVADRPPRADDGRPLGLRHQGSIESDPHHTDGGGGLACGLSASIPQTMAQRGLSAVGGVAAILLAASIRAAEPGAASSATVAEQRTEINADAPKTILELQPFRIETRVPLRRADGSMGLATLTNLNPYVNTWYLLSFDRMGTPKPFIYHLESPRRQTLHLLADDNNSVRIALESGTSCPVWVNGEHSALDEAAASGLPYAPVCAGQLYVRNVVAGHQTSLERVTDFLRDHIWGGDRVITFVKHEFYRDAFLEKDRPASAVAPPVPSGGTGLPAPAPTENLEQGIVPERLSLELEIPGKELLPGQWYPVRDLEGVSVSVIAPEHLASAIRFAHEASVNTLGPVESVALVYLVAFDLERFDLHFALGTEHPRLDWSDRPPASSRNLQLPGPDGVASAAPLVRNGMVSPADIARTIATFTGGFKREHGAFRYGPLAERNHGSHYGFIEEGVIFSKLEPGLATVLVMNDGAVTLKTWMPPDEAQLARVRYARQNGVPLIEFDAAHGTSVPGEFVNLWGPGNWSGSANEDLRTLRAGLCLQEKGQHRFLIYGYFSSATPSAMARIFQGYHCRYAMQSDINAPEHTYLALYVTQGQNRLVEHLVEGMQAVDRKARNALAPRFLAFPDDRDFFYVTRREGS